MWKSRTISLMLLAAVVGCAWLARAFEHPSDERLHAQLIETLAAYRQRGLLKMPQRGLRDLENAYFKACIQFANDKLANEFEGIHFNEPPQPGWITVCFFDSDADGKLRAFANNCAYVGFENLIVCDLKYVRRFQDVPRPAWADSALDTVAEQFPQFGEQVDRSVWLWLVGHEIGHIAHGHTASHFVPSGRRPQTPGRHAPQEEQADLFAVRAMLHEMPQAQLAAPIVRAALARRIEIWAAELMHTGDQPPTDLFNPNVRIQVPGDGSSHLPLFVRAVDLSYFLVDFFGLEDPERYRVLRQRIQIME